MKRAVCALLGLLLLCAFPITVRASAPDDLFDLPGAEALPGEAAEWMNGATAESVIKTDFWQGLASRAAKALAAALRSSGVRAGMMLAVVLLCSLTEAAGVAGGGDTVRLAGVAAIGAAAVADVNSYIARCTKALEELADYVRLLMPALSGAAAAAGEMNAAAGRCAATMIFLDALLQLSEGVVVPLVCGCAALSVADAAVGNGALRAAAKLMKNLCTFALSGVALAFVTGITITGAVGGGADALSQRVAKTAVSTALPVVGRIMSDAAGTLAAAAGVVRSTAGVFGLAAVLCISLAPFLEMGGRYLMFKLTAAVCACLTEGRLPGLLEDLSACFGMLLSLLGIGALCLFLALFSFLGVMT